MPPSIGDIWNGLKSSFTGSGNGKSGAEGAHDSRTNARNDPACENPDFQEVEDPNTKKRKVAVQVEVSRKRFDRRSEHEKRLAGDFNVPSDAVLIRMPGSFDGAEGDRSAGVSSMIRSKPGGGGFKPRDTLMSGSLQATSGVNGVNGTQPRHVPERAQVSPSPFAYRSRSRVVAGGDGFSSLERDAPAAKKRKIAQGAQRDLANDPIELDNDDEEPSASRVTAVNNRPVKTNGTRDRTQRGVRSESRTAPFESNEARTVDKVLHMEQHKPRRKIVNGYTSSQTSSRASPANMTNGHSGTTAADAVVLDDDTSQEISQRHARPASSSASSELPEINLMNGVNEITQAKQRWQSESSVKYSRTQKKASMPPPNVVDSRSRAHPLQQPANERQKRRRTPQDHRQPDPRPAAESPTDRHDYENAQHQAEDERLGKKFVRDDQTSLQQLKGTTRRRTAMRAESAQARVNISPARDSLSSVDELCGGTTVGSVSPEKRQLRLDESRTRVNGVRTSRSPSESDLRPTQFTRGQRTQTPRLRTPARKRRKGQGDDDRPAIPLKAFCATSCVLGEGSGKIMLHYDERENEFDIYCNEVMQVVRGGQCNVSVSRTEVGTITHGKESPYIHFRGSVGAKGISNGHICIALQDLDDKNWIWIRLLSITGDKIQFKLESEERMKAIYTKQVNEIVTARKRQPSNLVDDSSAVRTESRARNTLRQSDGDDEIRYETGKSARSSVRKGMLGDEIEDYDTRTLPAQFSGGQVRSRFWPPERRSTRQTKPVKQRSPTPPPIERWTKTNMPERWPHSIVYPTEGVRRVTVDFQDLERLDEGEFLNDNVISFALRRIEEKMAPEHKERVHFFNSFFYTALTTKNGKKALNYDAVKRWTKSKDLLGCDYVVVPINIELHWFVAIICNLPNLSRRPSGLEGEDDGTIDEDGAAEAGQELSSDLVEPPNVGDAEQQSAGETFGNTKAMRNLSLSDDEGKSKAPRPDEEDGTAATSRAPVENDPEIEHNGKKPAPVARGKGKRRGPPSYDTDKPAIITFDSFGAPHTAEVRNLKDYVKAEAEAKRGMELDTSQLQGANIRGTGIPTQSNFCDCGVYLVGYVEQFAKNPREFATKALKRKLGQEGEFADFDPSSKRDEIREELLALQKEQESEYKMKKAGKKVTATKRDGQAAVSASATPKPESKPASKAASPVKGTAQPNATLAAQPQRQKASSWAPADAAESTTQPETLQDKDLDYVVPRALGSSPPTAVADAPSADELQAVENESEEMLDEPDHRPAPDHPGAYEEFEPTPLLDSLSVAVRRNSEQAQLDLDAQAPEAAAKGPETVGSEGDDFGDDVEEGPEMITNADVIELGDEQDEIRKRTEIPDSQEQASLRRRAATAWAGKRISLD